MGWECTSHLTGTAPAAEVTGRELNKGDSHGDGEGEENIPTFCVPSPTYILFSPQSSPVRTAAQRRTGTCKLVRVRI